MGMYYDLNLLLQQTCNSQYTHIKFYRGNPYKKVATFASFFCVHSRCPPFLFISDEHIVKQSKTSLLQNNFHKKSIFYILCFFKDIQYCQKKEKVWTPLEKLKLKQLLFLRATSQETNEKYLFW